MSDVAQWVTDKAVCGTEAVTDSAICGADARSPAPSALCVPRELSPNPLPNVHHRTSNVEVRISPLTTDH